MTRVKKIFSLAIMIVMVLTMNITAFATSVDEAPAQTATVTVKNLPSTAKITYKQIVENSDAGGWVIIGDDMKAIFDTFKTQAITDPLEGYAKADEKDRVNAFANASVGEGATTLAAGVNSFTVTKAGLYLITIEDTDEDYIYKNMIASIGFNFDSAPATLNDCEFKAKMGKTKVDKTADMQFVENLQEIEYTITARIPYIPGGTAPTGNYQYLVSVKDVITGGEYVGEDEKLTIDYAIGDKTGKLQDVAINKGEGTENVVIPLDSFIVDSKGDITNEYANQEIVLKYKARITADVLENKATPNYWGNDKTEVSYKAVAGKIEITKTTTEDGAIKTVSGAKFVIKKNNTFAKLDDNKRLIKWVATAEEATKIETDSYGIAEAYGFDREETYKAQEYSAPTGYSIKTADVDITWNTQMYTNPENKATIITEQLAQGTLDDEKLIKLPFTGGSGTAAFTGLGVLFMSIAAALYFINKNKKNKSIK